MFFTEHIAVDFQPGIRGTAERDRGEKPGGAGQVPDASWGDA